MKQIHEEGDRIEYYTASTKGHRKRYKQEAGISWWIHGYVPSITSTKSNDSSSPLHDVSTCVQLEILRHREKDWSNIHQAPFPKLSHPQCTYKFQTTDPARPPGSPVEPQTSKASSHEAQKHCIEFLMKKHHGQEDFVIQEYQLLPSESSLNLCSGTHVCLSHDTTINGGLEFFFQAEQSHL